MRLNKEIKEDILHSYTVKLIKNNEPKLQVLANKVNDKAMFLFDKHIKPIQDELVKIKGLSMSAMDSYDFQLNRQSVNDKTDKITTEIKLIQSTKIGSASWSNPLKPRFNMLAVLRQSMGYYCLETIDIESKISKADFKSYSNHHRKLIQFVEKLKSVEAKADRVIYSVNTSQQLLKSWPECKEFLPEEIENNKGLVIVPSEINEAAGIVV